MSVELDDDLIITKESTCTQDAASQSSVQVIDFESSEENVVLAEENIGIDSNKQNNYRIWKKNSKILYDYLNTNNLKWPSLSVNVLPYMNQQHNNRFYLITSFTSDQLPEDEKIILTNVSTLNIPKSDLNCFEMENMEFQVLKNSNFKSKKDEQDTAKSIDLSLTAQDEIIKEYKPHNLKNDIEITFPAGEQCNRVSVNLRNPDIFATASTKHGNVYIYDKTKCITTNSSVKNLMSTNYVINLNGFNDTEDVEIACLEWNNLKEAELATGLTNGLIQVWDLKSIYRTDKNTYREPSYFTVVDDQGINDLSYMPDHDSIIAVGCESLYMQLFDTRSQNTIAKVLNASGNNSINSLQFNPKNSNLIAAGCSDQSGEINIHDIRRIDKPVLSFSHSVGNTNEFISANNSISKIQWNPFLPNILLSAGMEDGLVKIWDTISPATSTETKFESNLIFTHGGHMLGVTDCCWDLFDPWILASCSFDNSLQIWKPSKRILDEYLI